MIRILRIYRQIKLLVFLATIVSLAIITAHAQQTVSGATLSGTILDQNNSALSGTSISATNLEINQTKTTTSDAEGRFRFAYLPVGNYEIKADASGFTPASRKLTATVGQALEIKIELEIREVSAQVEVTNDTTVIETNRTQVAETILPKDVENLPLNGRNFLDLALLIPGVSRTNTGSVQRFAETSAVPGTGISVAGQRNLANSFIVDGSSANDDSVELAGILL